MTDFNLDSLLDSYVDIKRQEEELVSRKNDLADKIKSLLENEPNGKYESSTGLKATLVEKTVFKYNDETAIINYITKKGLKDIFLVKKIDAIKFNNELKTKGSLFEDVKSFVIESKQKSLTVNGGK